MDRPRGVHPDGHDIGVVVLLVVDRGRHVPEEAKRDLAFHRRPGGPLAEEGDPVLEVLVAGGRDELQDRAVPFLVGDEQQASARGLLPPAAPGGRVAGLARRVTTLLRREQGEQGLFARRIEPARHLLVPAAPGCERTKELPHPRQDGDVEVRFEAPPARGGELEKHGHRNGREAARGHSVLKEAPGDPRHVIGKDDAVLEADPDPEREPRHQALAVVEAVLHHHPHAEHEEQREKHGDVGGRDRPRNREDRGEHLGQERGREEDGPDRDPDAPRRDPGELGDRDAGRVGGVGDGPREAGQQVPHPVRRHRPLHGPEVHRARPAPRHALNRDGVAEGLDGADQGHEHECGQEPPEDRPEPEVEAGPPDLGKADPPRLGDAADVVDAVVPCDRRAGDDPDDRRPES